MNHAPPNCSVRLRELAKKLFASLITSVISKLGLAIAGALIFAGGTVWLALSGMLVSKMKDVLGINALEEQFSTLEDHLFLTEDTVFSYKYEFVAPDFGSDLDDLILRGGHDLQKVRSKIYSSVSGTAGEFFDRISPWVTENTELKEFISIQERVMRPIRKVFYFSAAHERTEINLTYELSCFDSDGNQATDPIDFEVSVNGTKIPAYEQWKGNSNNVHSYLSRDTPFTTITNHHVYRQRMILTLFPDVTSWSASDVRNILLRTIHRCTFDAMIFVRDIMPGQFVRRLRSPNGEMLETGPRRAHLKSVQSENLRPASQGAQTWNGNHE